MSDLSDVSGVSGMSDKSGIRHTYDNGARTMIRPANCPTTRGVSTMILFVVSVR